MIQDISTFIIVLLTLFYVGFSIVKNLKAKKIPAKCSGCTGCAISDKHNSCNH